MKIEIRKKLSDIYSYLELSYEALTSSLFWLIVCFSLMGGYVLEMLYLAYILHMHPWITIGGPLIPMVVAWYLVMRKRVENYIKMMTEPQKIVDFDTALADYRDMLKKQREKKKRWWHR